MEQLLDIGTKVIVKVPNYEKGVVEEKEYLMRRLSTRDVFRFTRILSKVGKQLLDDFAEIGQEGKLDKQKSRELGLKIIALLPELEDEAINFLSSLLNVEPEEFETFTMDSMIDIVTALIQSQDIKAFFNKAKGILNLNK